MKNWPVYSLAKIFFLFDPTEFTVIFYDVTYKRYKKIRFFEKGLRDPNKA